MWVARIISGGLRETHLPEKYKRREGPLSAINFPTKGFRSKLRSLLIFFQVVETLSIPAVVSILNESERSLLITPRYSRLGYPR